MKIIKRLLLGLFIISLVAVAGFYLYIKSLPTMPPEFVAAADVFSAQPLADFSCDSQGQFDYAYEVDVLVESKLNDQLVYRSKLGFDIQMQQAKGNVIKGLAVNISIDEGQGEQAIKDVAFLGRVAAGSYTVFSAYNGLALHQQHPMSVLSQVLKALSVGEQGQAYNFAYDPLQRTYRYRHVANKVERASYPTTADASQLSGLFDEHKSNWTVVLGDDCVPVAVESEEIQGISSSGSGGYIRFRIVAKLIPSFMAISEGLHGDLANAANTWQLKEVDNSEFVSPIENREHMWEVFNAFSGNKNVAELVKAAQFMLDNVSSAELSGILQGSAISDAAKRDLIFGLGIARRAEAERYILDAITALPVGEGNNIDLQKVRLMVAVSSNGLASIEAYTALESLLNNSTESSNVHKNALLNMGALVTQLSANGQDTSSLQSDLSATVRQQLESGDSASAILAAGNAQLEGLDDVFGQSLQDGDARERYAAGTVLARDTANYALLIEHIAVESSNLVVNAIVEGMRSQALTAQQLQRVEAIQSTASGDRVAILNKLLGSQ